MAKNDWDTIISGGVCTSGTLMDLRSLDRVRVSSYHIGSGAIVHTGALTSLYDIAVDGTLHVRDTLITKMTVPTGGVTMWGSASCSRVLVGGHLDCSDKAVLTELSVVNGGRVAVQGSAFVRDVTVCSGGKLDMYGNTSAHDMTISSGASVTLYGQAEANKVHVCSGGFLECWDDTHTSDVYVAEGATFVCHDGAEVIYQRDSPQKPIDFGVSAACQSTDQGLVDIYRAKVTVYSQGLVEIDLPVSMQKDFAVDRIHINWKDTKHDKR